MPTRTLNARFVATVQPTPGKRIEYADNRGPWPDAARDANRGESVDHPVSVSRRDKVSWRMARGGDMADLFAEEWSQRQRKHEEVGLQSKCQL